MTSKYRNKFIVFLGVDGSGKTTLIAELKKNVNYSFIFHFCPSKRYNAVGKYQNVNPHKYKTYNNLITLIKLLFLIFHFNWGYITKIVSNKKRGLVIGDRYYYDILIDPKRYRIKNNKKLILFIGKYFIFKPDLVFICRGDVKTIYERKKEISEYEIDMQQKTMNELHQLVQDSVILNTTKFKVQDLVKIIVNSI